MKPLQSVLLLVAFSGMGFGLWRFLDFADVHKLIERLELDAAGRAKMDSEDPSGYFLALCIISFVWGFSMTFLRGLTANLESDSQNILAPIQTGNPLWFLNGFEWFIPRNQRDDFKVILRDLKKDIRDMRKQGLSEVFVGRVIAWRTMVIVITYLWGGFKAIMSNAPLVWRFLNHRG